MFIVRVFIVRVCVRAYVHVCVFAHACPTVLVLFNSVAVIVNLGFRNLSP